MTRPPTHPEGELVHLALSGSVDSALNAVLIQPGEANGLVFGRNVLEARAALFNGVPAFVDHAGPADRSRPGQRSVRDLAGSVSHARWSTEHWGVVGTLNLLPRALWIVELARAQPPVPRFGLSADLHVRRQDKEVVDIVQVHSVDIVVNPAAGGRFLLGGPECPPPTVRGADELAPPAPTHERSVMSEALSEIRVQQANTASGAGASGSDDATHRADRPISQAASAADATGVGPAGAPGVLGGDGPGYGAAFLDLCLRTSGLAPEACELVRAQLAARLQEPGLTPATLSAEVERYRRALAPAYARSSIRGLGYLGQVLAPIDRVTMAFENLLGVGDTEAHRSIPRLSGIRELYDLLTGDHERYGLFRAERVQLANATTSTMNDVVANVLNKALIKHYQARERWWQPIAHEEDFASLRDIKWTYVAGFSDLDTVAEGGSYTEKTWSDVAETGSFVKKGNYIGITLEMIDRDDVAAVRSIPRKLAYAAERTLSTAVAALFTANAGAGPTLADSVALFHASHSNLGTTALSAAEWNVVQGAMFKQTELGSSKRLGLRPRYCLVPIELFKTAMEIFTSDLVPGDSTTTRRNIYRDSANVIVVPDWTDANDWAAVADPDDIACVCIGYRYGRTPEIFVADGEQTGSMFTNDEMRIKCRWVYSVGIGDYRGLYKENVT